MSLSSSQPESANLISQSAISSFERGEATFFKVAKCDLKEIQVSHRLTRIESQCATSNRKSYGERVSIRSHPIYALGFEWTTVMVDPHVAATSGTKHRYRDQDSDLSRSTCASGPGRKAAR